MPNPYMGSAIALKDRLENCAVVRLYPAFMWFCPKCWCENACPRSTGSFEQEAMIATMVRCQELGKLELCDDHLPAAPDQVTCAHCHSVFFCEEHRYRATCAEEMKEARLTYPAGTAAEAQMLEEARQGHGTTSPCDKGDER